MMHALVVYESMFGNTEEVARAVAEGLAEQLDVELHEVSHAPAPVTDPVDLIVAGGPTHAFSLSRESTREEAVKQGATHGQTEFGLRDWLGKLDDRRHVEKVAAFDTRVATMRKLPGSAANKAVRVAHRHGYASAGSESFFVKGTEGPVLPGELDRAREWGRQLAAQTRQRADIQP